MNKLLTLGSVLPILAFAFFLFASAVPVVATVQDGTTPVSKPLCNKKIVSNPCTSCNESGVMDNECKGNGSDWRTCASLAPTTCSNGANCDNDTGGDGC